MMVTQQIEFLLQPPRVFTNPITHPKKGEALSKMERALIKACAEEKTVSQLNLETGFHCDTIRRCLCDLESRGEITRRYTSKTLYPDYRKVKVVLFRVAD